MATDIQPIGFLCSVGGNRRGIGEDYVKKLDAAGKPAVCFTNDDFGGISDAIALLNSGSKVPHICVYRVVKVSNEAFAVPRYDLDAKPAAEEFKNRIQPFIPEEVKKNRKHIWLLVGNELDDEKADWLGNWSYESALLWNAEGYKIATVGWNSGTPKDPVEDWKKPGNRKYLTYCAQHPDKAAVNVHEYSFIKSDILHEYPYKVGRFQFLYKACDEMGIPRVPLLIGEWGWEKDHVPDRDQARSDVRNVANLYSQFPQILGAGIWYLGDYQKRTIANETQRLIKPIGEDAAQYKSGKFSKELIIDPDGGVTELVNQTDTGKDPDDKPDTGTSGGSGQEITRRPATAFGGLITGPVELDASLKAITTGESSSLAEVSRQVIVLSKRAGADAVQLRVSQRKDDQWQLQTSLSKTLDAEIRLEIVFLRGGDGSDRTGQDETDQEGDSTSIEGGTTDTPESVPPPLAEPLLGMDISRHQDKNIDFKKAAAGGVRYCYIRVGSGLTKKDANFEHNYTEAGKAGLLRGIYYYQYPESEAKQFDDPSDKTPEGQARRFIRLLKKDAELGAVLDVEAAGLPQEEVKRFVDEFQKHDPYDRPITIYTSWGYWSKPHGYAGSAVDWAAKHPLWVAHHTSSKRFIKPSKKFKVLFPKPWKIFGVHQWTKVGGNFVGQGNNSLDLDYFAGSEAELLEWSRTGVMVERTPGTPPDDEPKRPTIDLLAYIKGDGRQYEVKSEHGDEHFQIQEEGDHFYLVKNRHWEQFFYDDDFIYRDADTSPGGGKYYRHKDPDLERGSRWIRRNMAIGETFTQSKNVQFYNTKDGSKSTDNSGDVTDNIKLVAHHKTIKFRTKYELEDVIEVHWLKEDLTPREKYFFAKSFGLVAWAREHEDINSPSSSAIYELSSGGRNPEKREKVAGIET